MIERKLTITGEDQSTVLNMLKNELSNICWPDVVDVIQPRHPKIMHLLAQSGYVLFEDDLWRKSR